MPGPISTWTGDSWQADKSSRYATSHPSQLSLAILPWVGTMSIGESWGVNRHIIALTQFLWFRSVSWWPKTEISAALREEHYISHM